MIIRKENLYANERVTQAKQMHHRIQPYLDIEVDDVLVVDKDESLQELSGEADDVTFIGHHVLVKQSLQVAAGTTGKGRKGTG